MKMVFKQLVFALTYLIIYGRVAALGSETIIINGNVFSLSDKEENITLKASNPLTTTNLLLIINDHEIQFFPVDQKELPSQSINLYRDICTQKEDMSQWDGWIIVNQGSIIAKTSGSYSRKKAYLSAEKDIILSAPECLTFSNTLAETQRNAIFTSLHFKLINFFLSGTDHVTFQVVKDSKGWLQSIEWHATTSFGRPFTYLFQGEIFLESPSGRLLVVGANAVTFKVRKTLS